MLSAGLAFVIRTPQQLAVEEFRCLSTSVQLRPLQGEWARADMTLHGANNMANVDVVMLGLFPFSHTKNAGKNRVINHSPHPLSLCLAILFLSVSSLPSP